jgi:hypothetical protein
MNKRVFNQYISESNFKELFIREMGWNNPKGQTDFDLTIEDTTYELSQIAERNGFQVLTCQVNEIPSSSLCKKIDSRLRRFANDYICIFHIPNTEHHLWVVPVKKVEKRDLVLVEYASAEKAEFLFDKIDRISFDLDEHTTIMDVKDRIHEGFIINSEKITKDFYTGFRKEHTNFAKYITGIDDEITDLKKNRNKQWYTSVMLNRLMFCYFIQKKGFLDLNADYLRDKLAWVRKEKGEDRFYDSFYRGFLVSLFHDGLNSPRHQPDFEKKYGRIPYLNGGMFGIHELEDQYPTLDIADEAFESLFAFFDQWHWHLDDRLTASGKDINPDVLGYIFEQYINDRAQMGAYYTKEDITEYIGRNTIVPYLMDATKKTDERPFKTNGEVWQFLKESGDTYIFDAVKKGKNEEIPEEIAIGIDTTKPNLLERRSHWNERTPEAFALPTEIWRETIERLQRYKTIKTKITNGEITEINDFITYNLDIRQFVQDLLAKTDDHLFVKHFYAQLQKVTILDPTCGSGAFLFAALNILEPLYEVCIERMQTWNNDNPNLFKEELEELYGRYRSNIRYFIYKNIILRNLYGVDIMVEATEIAKLRLFLKMVAVVDVVPRDSNLGLDPLPDIDFNIRCGNTLVGYATSADLEKDLVEGDMFANAEFKDKVDTEMDIVSHAYETFKKVQLEQDTDLETFRNAKKELKARLKNLNDLLNHKQYSSTVSAGWLKYEEWLKSHQPFNWLAEYYDIINGKGGFGVVIGNPPYVVYTKKDKDTGKSVADTYKITNYRTIESNNLYAFTIERALKILSKSQRIGMIVPLSLTAAKNMYSLRSLMTRGKYLSVSSYEIRPGKLFDGNKGADQRLNIFISSASNKEELYTTKVLRWASEHRKWLFCNLHYNPSLNNERIWRFSSPVEFSIYKKYSNDTSIGQYVTSQVQDPLIHYRSAGLRYWIIFLRNGFNTESASNKSKHICNQRVADYLMAALNSNLFWWYYSTNYDMFNLTESNIFDFNLGYDKENDVGCYSKKLEDDMDKNKSISIVNKSDGGVNQSFAYQKKLSKPIVDEIDMVLKEHYGFTEEELDFIINYDIKYRMGDELGEDSGSEAQPRVTQQTNQKQKPNEQIIEPREKTLTVIVRHDTLERISSGEKTTFKRYLDDEEFAKEVLITENGKIKLSDGYCPYTAKNITAIKLVCDGESLVKKVTKISFRTGVNQQGKTDWKIVFHF